MVGSAGSGMTAGTRAEGAGSGSSEGEGGVEVGRAAVVVVAGFAGGRASKSSS